jgi:hypothetical protein
MKFGRLLSLAVLAATMLVGSESRASLITLSNTANNLSGNSFVIGDKTFSFQNVTATNTVLSSIQVNPLSPVGTTQAGAIPPFGFQLAGGVVSAAAGQSSDLLLNFTVTSSGPLITSVTLFATGGGLNGGSAIISETLTNGNGGGSEGSFSLSGGGQTTFVLTGPATNNLIVSKDINVNGGSAGGSGTASYSDVRNVFNQGVPEPASVVMLGCGLVGVLGLSLRRMKKTA